jgi:hypothetical protein
MPNVMQAIERSIFLIRSHSCECPGCDGCAPHNSRRAVVKCRTAFVGLEKSLPPKWGYGTVTIGSGEKFALLCPVCEPHRTKEPQPEAKAEPKV